MIFDIFEYLQYNSNVNWIEQNDVIDLVNRQFEPNRELRRLNRTDWVKICFFDLGVSRKWSSILDSGLFATMKWIFKSGFFLRDSVTWQSRWWQSRDRFWFFKMLQGEWPVTLGAKSIRSEVVTFEQFTDDSAMTSLTGPRDVISGHWPAKSWISLVKVSIAFWFYCGWDALTPKFYKVSSPLSSFITVQAPFWHSKISFSRPLKGRLKSLLINKTNDLNWHQWINDSTDNELFVQAFCFITSSIERTKECSKTYNKAYR